MAFFGTPIVIVRAEDPPPVHVETLRPVASPDSTQVAFVDHLQPEVAPGERDITNGQLRLRIRLAKDPSIERIRDLEAPRIRALRAPEWMDTRWLAVEYDISRTSRGIAYLDTATGRVLQVEIVMTSPSEGAGRGDQNLTMTYYELTDTMPDGTGEGIVSFARGNSVIFPLSIPTVPAKGQAAKLREDGSSHLDDILEAVQAWANYRSRNQLEQVSLDQASESIAPDESGLAGLVCTNLGSRFLVIPIGRAKPAEALALASLLPLPSKIRLNCDESAGGSEPGQSQPASGGHFGEQRHITTWLSPTTVQIIRETFANEGDRPDQVPVLQLDLNSQPLTLTPAVPVQP